jgi:hypothetical protein
MTDVGPHHGPPIEVPLQARPRVAVIPVARTGQVGVETRDPVSIGFERVGTPGPPGPPGATGPAGAQGPEGDPGPSGADGPQGPTGPRGEPGQSTLIVGYFGQQTTPADLPPDGLIPADFDGPGRPADPQQMDVGHSLLYDPDGDLWTFVDMAVPEGWINVGHVVGPEGAEGPQGLQGAAGEQGPQGGIGPSGPQGDTGPKGDTGDKGDPGDKGDQGDPGDKGDQGDPGPQGLQGDQGLTGAKGDPGDRGDEGPPGVAGPEGPDGPEGARGEKGDQGDEGPEGPQGVQGPPGTTGSQGPAGDKGDTGEEGPRGPDGPRGEPGQSTVLMGEFGQEKVPADLPPDGLILADFDGPGRPGVDIQMQVGWSLLYEPDGDLWTFVDTALPGGWANVGHLVGPEGPQGIPGLPGAKGDDGDRGPEGPQGIQGETGAQGPTGAAGTTGPEGPAGPGLPPGGLVGQVPVKASSAVDFDTDWDYATDPTKLFLTGGRLSGPLELGTGTDDGSGDGLNFGFAGGAGQYLHRIRSRHDGGGVAGNALDFYTHDGSPSGLLGLTVENGRVYLGDTYRLPVADLEAITKRYIDDLMALPPPSTSAVIESFIDGREEVWVARAGVDGGNWHRARDAIHYRGYRNAAFTFTAAGVVLPMDAITDDPYLLYNTATGQFTCPVPGRYHVSGKLAASTGTNPSVNILSVNQVLNGAFYCFAGGATVGPNHPNSWHIPMVPGTIKCAAGDTLSITINRTTNAYDCPGLPGAVQTYMTIDYVGGARATPRLYDKPNEWQRMTRT